MSSYNQSYGQNYGQSYGKDQGAYQQPSHSQSGAAAGYYDQPAAGQQAPSTGYEIGYASSSATNPGAADGERGLGTNLLGAAAGGVLGHKLGGHGLLGAVAGGIGAHLLGKQSHKPSHGFGQSPSYSSGHHQQSGLSGMMHQFTGKRERDPSVAQQSMNSYDGASQGHNQQYDSSYGQSYAQPAQPYGQAPNPNQTYGSGYGQ
jgi:hypothetical protein